MNLARDLKIQDFEREALSVLCAAALPSSTLHAALNKPREIRCKFTGAGYFLEIDHEEIPAGRVVCSEPCVTGLYQGKTVGFVAFVEEGVMTLECHDYGHGGILEEIRYGVVQISVT